MNIVHNLFLYDFDKHCDRYFEPSNNNVEIYNIKEVFHTQKSYATLKSKTSADKR